MEVPLIGDCLATIHTLPGALVVDRISRDRTGHAVITPATTAELGPGNGNDFDTFLAQQGIRIGVTVVGEDNAGRDADKIGAAVPLRALAHIRVAPRFDHAHFLEAKRDSFCSALVAILLIPGSPQRAAHAKCPCGRWVDLLTMS